jgi:hypothetical protein
MHPVGRHLEGCHSPQSLGAVENVTSPARYIYRLGCACARPTMPNVPWMRTGSTDVVQVDRVKGRIRS